MTWPDRCSSRRMANILTSHLQRRCLTKMRLASLLHASAGNHEAFGIWYPWYPVSSGRHLQDLLNNASLVIAEAYLWSEWNVRSSFSESQILFLCQPEQTCRMFRVQVHRRRSLTFTWICWLKAWRIGSFFSVQAFVGTWGNQASFRHPVCFFVSFHWWPLFFS